MPTPFPHQLEGAAFLASRQTALLADLPRVGKTGSAIIAADYVLADRILVITTASGRPVWKRGLAEWSAFDRNPQILAKRDQDILSNTVVVGWPSLTDPYIMAKLSRNWDLIILDESHYAKNMEAKRTQAAYSLVRFARRIWCLTGTPIPNAPNDLFPMLYHLAGRCLQPVGDWPAVQSYEKFLKRYCIVKPKKISQWNWIDVVIGGKNLDELRDRMGDFMLRRTQADVGIRESIFETLPLMVSEKIKREVDAGLEAKAVLAAAEAGDTKSLEMHLGPLRRLTGEIKARAVVEAVKDEFESGLDKIVLMAWHKDAITILKEGLALYGVVCLDGSTPAAKRGEIEQRFLKDPKIRVFVGQIQAAGEAIDLSSASELIFVEASFTPKDMSQAAMRVSNHSQPKQTRVRVATLEGSIDEALQQVLMRKWQAIREVLR